MNIKKVLFKLVDYITWLSFTKRCRYCNTIIEKDQELCADCKESLPIIKGERCQYCGVEKSRCACKKHKMGYDGITAPFYYEGGAKRSVHLLKFNGKIFMADILAEDMAKCVKEDFADIEFDFITFVPFSLSQKLKRNYNQSELLAEKLSEELNVPLKNVLVKLFDTQTQHNMGAKYRKGNVFGVYDVKEKADVKGKIVLLVDDVKTSGATLDDCAWILKIRGAEKVYCVTATIGGKRKEDKKKAEVN